MHRTLKQNILQLERLLITAAESSRSTHTLRAAGVCAAQVKTQHGRESRPDVLLRRSRVSARHSEPQQMALDVNCFKLLLGFVCSSSHKKKKKTLARAELLPADLLEKVKLGSSQGESPLPFYRAILEQFQTAQGLYLCFYFLSRTCSLRNVNIILNIFKTI